MNKAKKCSGCQEIKPLEIFYKNKLVLDGHSNYCTICTKENSRKYHQRKKLKNMLGDNKSVILNGNEEIKMEVVIIKKMMMSLFDKLENVVSQ
jgi:hypothetical protein